MLQLGTIVDNKPHCFRGKQRQETLDGNIIPIHPFRPTFVRMESIWATIYQYSTRQVLVIKKVNWSI
jgi:hypothetical protein